MPPKKSYKKKKSTVPWQWKDDAGDWNEFGVEDADMLEKKYNEGTTSKFSTTDFSWNQEYQTVYTINFKKMTQGNGETGVARAIRRDGGVNFFLFYFVFIFYFLNLWGAQFHPSLLDKPFFKKVEDLKGLLWIFVIFFLFFLFLFLLFNCLHGGNSLGLGE